MGLEAPALDVDSQLMRVLLKSSVCNNREEIKSIMTHYLRLVHAWHAARYRYWVDDPPHLFIPTR